jgi:hypothetical protein
MRCPRGGDDDITRLGLEGLVLDRLLIFGRRQLEHVLRAYIRHFNSREGRTLSVAERGLSGRRLAPADPWGAKTQSERQRSFICRE